MRDTWQLIHVLAAPLQAVEMVGRSRGIQRAKDLAAAHCRMAADMVGWGDVHGEEENYVSTAV